MFLKNKEIILVLGLGKSGFAGAKLAKSKGYEVIALDEAENENLSEYKSELKSFGIKVLLSFKGGELPHSDLIIVSPGIGPKTNLGKLADKSGKPIISETEFAAKYCSVPIIAITGTNGKTTTTEFCVHVLKNLQKRVIGAGNIGYPLSDVLLSNEKYDYIVLEISSFQLHYCKKFRPHIAIILNIESDHIDWHGTFENYLKDKLKIYMNQFSSDCLIVNKNLTRFITNYKGSLQTFSQTPEISNFSVSSDTIYKNKRLFCLNDELGVMGRAQHNLENAMPVIAVCDFLGFDRRQIIKAAGGFNLGEHRLEIILIKDGIIFVNDSKSTNPLSMMAALEAFGNNKNICLIAGGLDKDMNFTPILDYKNVIKKIFIIGKSKTKLENLCSQVFNYCSCLTFQEAVYSACDYAESGDVVLLSPGFASMDMFKNYIERGNIFKSLIIRRYIDEKTEQ